MKACHRRMKHCCLRRCNKQLKCGSRLLSLDLICWARYVWLPLNCRMGFLLSIWHFHKSINTLSTNNWHYHNLFIACEEIGNWWAVFDSTLAPSEFAAGTNCWLTFAWVPDCCNGTSVCSFISCVVWSFIRSLVGLQIGSRLGSFVGLLIGCWNRIKWLTRTWFPATGLRLVNACA